MLKILRKFTLVMAGIAVLMVSVGAADTYAAVMNEYEESIIESLTSESMNGNIDIRYVNQLENYFLRSDVEISKSEARNFISYFSQILDEVQEKGASGTIVDNLDMYPEIADMISELGLLFAYDTQIGGYYLTDSEGHIVIDFEDPVKETGDVKNFFSKITVVQVIYVLIMLGILVFVILSVKKIYVSVHSKNHENIIDVSENEEEQAGKKIRKRRRDNIVFATIRQFLKYVYYPLIMAAVIVAVYFIVANINSDFISSVKNTFVNTQPIYTADDSDYEGVGSAVESVNLANISYPNYGDQVGTLTNEDGSVDTDVFFGDRMKFLLEGAGMYSGSSLPGMGGTILIGAHDTTYFEGLENVEEGDEFHFETEYGRYIYKVTDIKIAEGDDYSDYYDFSAEEETLILYTCYPFGDLNGNKDARMFVYLELDSGTEITGREAN